MSSFRATGALVRRHHRPDRRLPPQRFLDRPPQHPPIRPHRLQQRRLSQHGHQQISRRTVRRVPPRRQDQQHKREDLLVGQPLSPSISDSPNVSSFGSRRRSARISPKYSGQLSSGSSQLDQPSVTRRKLLHHTGSRIVTPRDAGDEATSGARSTPRPPTGTPSGCANSTSC